MVRYRRILVAITGDTSDERALELAGMLSARKNAEVTLVYVVEVRQSLALDAEMPSEVNIGEQSLQRADAYARQRAEHRVQRTTPELLQARSAGAAIVDEAIERDVDVIVMASQNREVLGQTSLGETVPYVLKNATCEVIIIHEPHDIQD
jgi:nucleotide-binding universal stress UspA family protein